MKIYSNLNSFQNSKNVPNSFGKKNFLNPNNIAKALDKNSPLTKVLGQTPPPLVPKKVTNLFKKAYDSLTELIANRFIKPLANTKMIESILKFVDKHQVNVPRWGAAIFANILNAFYMYSVAKSDKLKKEQKSPLMLNMLITTVLSTLGGFAIDGAIDKALKPIENKIRVAHASKPRQEVDILVKGFKTAKSLLVFQMLYRFVAPVIATPMANWGINKYNDRKSQKIKVVD